MSASGGRGGLVIACSVIGAAHRRHNRPCQDASLTRELCSPQGERLRLLAVADGHGGSRYWLSQVGSQLACEQAAAAVEDALAHHNLADLDRWRSLLADGLPATIQARWRSAIESDWQQQSQAAGHAFSPRTYGSTLGLVLQAPGWWGCTGLGDWDLVRLAGSGSAALVSEEADQGGGAEATASLCLIDAARHWAERAQLVPIAPDTGPFCLLLSSDGLRKSCATDADFLTLSAHLSGLEDRSELAAALAEISAAGSGDDVSVAFSHWGKQAAAAWPAQPHPSPSRRRPRLQLLALAALGVALAIASRLGLLQPAPPLSSTAKTRLEQESQRLCRQPSLIAATLAQRQAQIIGLRRGDLPAAALLQAADRDPLGALIAASFPTGAEASPPAVPILSSSCVELRQALAQQWRLQGPDAGRMPAITAPTAPPLRP